MAACAWILIASRLYVHAPIGRLLPPGDMIRMLALVPIAHALRTTLLRRMGRPGGSRSRTARVAVTAVWLVFALVMLTWLHVVLMSWVFPYGGGEFHAVFAYSQGGRIDMAWYTWRVSVAILGGAAVAVALWLPLRWWMVAGVVCWVGVVHWWAVWTWRWQSPEFHRAAGLLLLAMPPAVLLIAGAGAAIRAAWGKPRPRVWADAAA